MATEIKVMESYRNDGVLEGYRMATITTAISAEGRVKIMSEIKFSEGIPERRDYFSRIIYPEELLDKKCGGCVRCELRDNRIKEKNSGYHCTTQDYDIEIEHITKNARGCMNRISKTVERNCGTYTQVEIR